MADAEWPGPIMRKGTAIPQVQTLHEVLDSGLIREWTCAVDGGAFIGEWSTVMAGRFQNVHAFEPCEKSRNRLSSNVPANVTVHAEALWHERDTVDVLAPPKRSTLESRYVKPDEKGAVQASPLDDLELQSCGLIKLDLEGAEYFALLGARRTIERCKPVIIVEMNKRGRSNYGLDGPMAADLLAQLGYQLVYERPPDMVYQPKC